MREYIIPANGHYSGGYRGDVLIYNKNKVVFDFILDESNIYDNTAWSPENKREIQKIGGLYNGTSENNSARLGNWCLDNSGKIDLLTYIHDNGPFKPESQTVLLKNAQLGLLYTCIIEIENGGYMFSLLSGSYYVAGKFEEVAGVKPSSGFFNFKFRCYPYGGGDMTVDHDRRILLNYR
jgi:hypothetical protein